MPLLASRLCAIGTIKKGDILINTRQQVINTGLQFLRELGSDAVCKVCIINGGSCCTSCEHLKDGVGCQKRNTSCTSWLCGFLSMLLFEMGYLQDWYNFWNQVPGRQHRKDNTPKQFKVGKWLESSSRQTLGESLARDIEEMLAKKNGEFDFIEVREEIELSIMTIIIDADEMWTQQARNKLNGLSKEFQHFHKAKEEWIKSLKKGEFTNS